MGDVIHVDFPARTAAAEIARDEGGERPAMSPEMRVRFPATAALADRARQLRAERESMRLAFAQMAEGIRALGQSVEDMGRCQREISEISGRISSSVADLQATAEEFPRNLRQTEFETGS